MIDEEALNRMKGRHGGEKIEISTEFQACEADYARQVTQKAHCI